MGASADWSANFAAASNDAMTIYDEVLRPRLFDPWAEVLLDAVGVGPGDAVLDVACGPGTVARRAAVRVGPGGAVTGCDLSPAMLAVAGAKATPDGAATVTYLECPADALAVPDAAFDAAVCQQGLQFFPDRVAALAEMRRALRPAGRLGVAIWTPIEEHPVFDAMARGLDEVLGKEVGDAYRGGPFGFTDPKELAALCRAAGFSEVRVVRHVLPVAFEGGGAQIATSLAVASIGQKVAALDPAGRAALVQAIETALGPHLIDGTAESDTVASLAIARR